MSDLPKPLPDGSRYLDRLTKRQRDVIRLVFDGLTNKEISHRLSVSVKTVEKHRKMAMEKMEVSCLVMLVRLMCRESETAQVTPEDESTQSTYQHGVQIQSDALSSDRPECGFGNRAKSDLGTMKSEQD